MIIRNWMQPHPITVTSETLVSEAKQLITDNNLHALPVVDNRKLRGLITRANCLRAGHFVSKTQNVDEFNFFTNRLRVRDIMVRRPATVDADDTMEHCLEKGRELGAGQFPVLDKGEVVGIISANEVFSLAAHFLGAWEKRSGVTLAPMVLEAGMIGKISDLVEGSGAVVKAIYPISKVEPPLYQEQQEKKVIVRFHAGDMKAVIKALEAGGFAVLESVEALH